MDATMENRLRQEQIESLGRLMAGFAHDMKNHLGIIRESNGLMDDIIAMGALDLGENNAKLVERLQSSTATIERRVVISAAMLHHLSGLAHRADTPYSSFHINDLIEEEYTFLERFSRLKQVDVVLEFGEDLSTLHSDPSLLQHVLYRLFSQCLDLLESGQPLTIVTTEKGKKAVIIFRFPKTAKMNTGAFGCDLLRATIEKLAGKLDVTENKNHTVDIRLTLSPLIVDDRR